MRVVFSANLIHSGKHYTGGYVTKEVKMSFVPSIDMTIEGLGLEKPCKVLNVVVDVEGIKYDAYVNISDIGCTTESDLNSMIEHLRATGWLVFGH